MFTSTKLKAPRQPCDKHISVRNWASLPFCVDANNLVVSDTFSTSEHICVTGLTGVFVCLQRRVFQSNMFLTFSMWQTIILRHTSWYFCPPNVTTCATNQRRGLRVTEWITKWEKKKIALTNTMFNRSRAEQTLSYGKANGWLWAPVKGFVGRESGSATFIRYTIVFSELVILPFHTVLPALKFTELAISQEFMVINRVLALRQMENLPLWKICRLESSGVTCVLNQICSKCTTFMFIFEPFLNLLSSINITKSQTWYRFDLISNVLANPDFNQS